MNGLKEAPYGASGNLLDWVGYYRDDVDWRPNEPFEATLRIIGMERGRSAASFIWEDKYGHRYPMFMTDLTDLLKRSSINGGVTTGKWIVRKRGQNYGLALADG